ncbi:hypothetical protein Slin14017_G113230 [Septoria linicola]|nr:hypothetical protein Slin14017_G113230 [Septoria linicola]
MSSPKPTTPSTNATRQSTQFFSTAPSAGADLPPGIPVSMIELCTYYPHATQRPDLIRRGVRSGWHSTTFAKAQLEARAAGTYTLLDLEKRDDTVRQQVAETFRQLGTTATAWSESPAGKPYDKPFPGTGRYEDLWHVDGLGHGKTGSSGAPTLGELVKGVKKFPKGEDRGVLTMVLEWAMEQGEEVLREMTTEDVKGIVEEKGFKSPKGAKGPNWDREALTRLALVCDV